ncbi:MAG: alpha/beta hydrolase [Bacteroidales bacterium]
MKKLLSISALLWAIVLCNAQTIPLNHTPTPGITYSTPERTFYSTPWATTVVTNVSEPTITVYEPSVDKRTGTAVVIAPGGGLYGLSINSEGRDVAQWLVAHGVTAFVLKYRLVPTGEDGTVEISQVMATDPAELMRRVGQVLPSSIEDGLTAVRYVREHAEEYGIDPHKIGFMGFSAGGAVTMGVGYRYEEASQPDFLVPIYPWTTALPVQEPRADAGPLFTVCASDDGVGLAPGTVELYSSYLKKEIPAELHMYSRGDHGFGMKVQDLPTDGWIERFYDWAVAEGIIVPRKP